MNPWNPHRYTRVFILNVCPQDLVDDGERIGEGSDVVRHSMFDVIEKNSRQLETSSKERVAEEMIIDELDVIFCLHDAISDIEMLFVDEHDDT